MSAETVTSDLLANWPTALEAERVRRQALRIAFAIAGGMVLLVAAGSVMPFLAPMFAAQFLITGRRPMKPAQAIGMAILIIGVGKILFLLTSLLGERPLVLLPLLWLLYLTCFIVQARTKGGQAAFLVLVIAIIVPLMELLHQDLGVSLILLLAGAVTGGASLAWAAHALFPDPGGINPAPMQVEPSVEFILRRSAVNASILLAALLLCIVDSRLSSAMVIPITVASVLGQIDLVTNRRAAFGLLVVNILGGLAASLMFAIVDAQPTLPGLFLVVLFVGIVFGAGAAGNLKFGKVYAGALTTFLILLGLGISPLPTSTPESFLTRITYVSAAVLYAFWACLLLWPRPSSRPQAPLNEHRDAWAPGAASQEKGG